MVPTWFTLESVPISTDDLCSILGGMSELVAHVGTARAEHQGGSIRLLRDRGTPQSAGSLHTARAGYYTNSRIVFDSGAEVAVSFEGLERLEDELDRRDWIAAPPHSQTGP
jgi:hypothetical protein